MEQTEAEKAKEIIEKYIPFCGMEMTEIQCALVEVNAIIEVLYSLKFRNELSEEILYYEKVRIEIIKQQEQ
jgi:hypothetical protein